MAILLLGRVAFGDVLSSPAYWGGTGLLEVPNGRVIEDKEVRIGVSHLYPYRTYYASLGFLPRLELNGRIVEILNRDLSETPGWEGYGYHKDKVVDVKFGVLKEGKTFPAVSIGAQDITGTKKFSSYYLATSKRCGPVDLTLGYGTERLKGLFGGAEFSFAPFSIIAEYNPIEYEKDKIRAVEERYSNYNYGLRFRPFKWVSLNLSHQNGREMGGMLNLSFQFGKSIVPWKPDPPYTHPADRRSLKERDKEEVERQIKEALLNQGFRRVGVSYVDRELFVEYENRRYLSEVKALGRVMRTSALLSPEETSKMIFVAKKAGFHLLKAKVSPDDLTDFINGKIQEKDFLELIEVSMETRDPEMIPQDKDKRISWGVKPTLETYLNDPSGFFKSRGGIDAWSSLSLWKGAGLYSWIKFPIYSDISTDLSPISEEPIRSDVVEYKKGVHPRLETATFDQVLRLGGKTFGIFSLGYLEEMFAGTREEIIYPIGDGRLTLGFEATQVTKREPDDSFKLKDFSTYTVLGSINYAIPDISLIIGSKTGRFLAGDHGTRFEIKRYFGDAAVGFWYTLTDMEDYLGGKPYYDKGVFIRLPINLFIDRDSKTTYSYALSPWTRDGGQMVWCGSLYDYLYRFYPFQVKSNIEDLLK